MNNRKSVFFLFFLFAALVIGCAPLRPPADPILDPKAFQIAFEAKSKNMDILSSRGKAWAKIEQNGQIERYRMVWAAGAPDKARITLLLTGTPVETIVFDGVEITFVSHTGKHDLYSAKSPDPNLGDYLEVSIQMSELIPILLGRLPLKSMDDAYFSPEDPSFSTVVVRDKEKERFYHILTGPGGRINGIGFKDRYGRALFDADILEYKSLESNDIPARITLRDPEGRTLFFDITDFEVNPDIKDSVFRLTPPGS